MAHVLVVDDESTIRRILERMLRERGHTTEQVDSGEAALAAARLRRPDLILLDLNMEGMGGMETLPRLCREVPGVPVVIMTGQGSIEIAVRAFKLGAVDFVTKPFEERKLRATLDALLVARTDGAPAGGPALVGESPRFREAMDLARKFAIPDINILLEGETGTGKELFARAIHAASKRSAGAFIPVDCSILSETLIESELFGHERGSFTGATTSRVGHFERADGGTLFLDEIGNLPLPFQAKLLRVLQERTLERVGGRETIKLDIRVVSATNVNLREAVRIGTFRQDLFYRLSQFTIRPPPLRERVGDAERIAVYFTRRYAAEFGLPVQGISRRALDLVAAYSWPGNVRELENAIRSAVVLAGDQIEPMHLPEEIVEQAVAITPPISVGPPSASTGPVSTVGPISNLGPFSSPFDEARERFKMEIEFGAEEGQLDLKEITNSASEKAERAVLQAILQKGRYNHAQLAKLMNVDPKTLRAKLRKYGLDSGTT